MTRVPNAASYKGGSALVLDQNYLLTTEQATNFIFSSTQHISTNMDQKLRIGDPLIADGEYHLYRLRDVATLYSGRSTLTLFSGAVSLYPDGMPQINNKKVDYYLSMKIEGDPSGSDPNNYATIYIDRIIIVETCDIYEITGTSGATATCKPSEGNMGICPICGKAAEDTRNKPAHTITGEYTYNPLTNIYTAECSVCDEVVEYEFEGRLPDSLLASLAETNTGLEHVREYIVADFELASLPTYARDPESPIGEAIRINPWDTANPGSFIGKSIAVNTYPGSALGTIPTASLKANENKGYQIYKLSDCVLPAGSFGYSHYWWMFNWQLQSREMMHDLNEWGGKMVDVYVSMKIEGRFDNYSDSTAGPFYYLDRIFVVDRCSDYCDMENPVFQPADCTNNAAWECVCTKCGNRIREEEEYTALGHIPGDFVYNADSGQFELICNRSECREFLLSVDALTVTFMSDGKITTQPVMSGEPVAAPADPVKDGYTFDGWFYAGEKYDFTKPVTGNIILVAQFTEIVTEEPTILEGKLAAIDVSLDSEILLRQKFLLPEELIKVTKCNRAGEYVEETDVCYEAEKDRYYIQIDDIASALLDYMYNVEITDAEGNVQNIRASVVCYLKRVLAVSTNVKQLNVFRSMCYYNQVANSYFGL